MDLAIVIAFGFVSLAELCAVFVAPTGKARTFVGAFLVFALALCQTAVLVIHPAFWSTALWLLGVFRVVNLMRFSIGRMEPNYLKTTVRRSTLRLLLLQTVAAGAAFGFAELGQTGLMVVLAVGLLINLSLLVSILKNTKRQTLAKPPALSRAQAPTITVAIPARNETEDLAFCIESLLASDYPKLEILVLDDCSQDNTPEVIKSFAHAGVRFIDGEEPSTSWLPKNAAYQKLLDEASGEYVIFCGVDVRFNVDTVRRLLATVQEGELNMIGLLPEVKSSKRNLSLLQIGRYFWELGVPRTLFNHPPALSTAWMVNRQSLQKLGGFKSVRRSIMPERQFAWEFSKTKTYRFLGNPTPELLTSAKSRADQIETAIRVRYPQLRKRPENVGLYLAFWVLLVVAPTGALVSGVFVSFGGLVYVLAGLSVLGLIFSFVVMYRMVAPGKAWLSPLVSLPIYILDLASLLVSMWRYEFGDVDWKGRNVCLPIMHVVPKLPGQKPKV